jgi:hypothetical protein
LPELWLSHEDDPNYISRYYTPSFYAQYGERWGLPGKFYAIRLEGSHFCQLEGPTDFSNVSVAAGINVVGQHRGAWVDIDGDGLNDLLLTQLSVSEDDPQNLTYYHNNGDGTFTDLTTEAGFDIVKYSSVNLFADIDNDGDKDLISIVAVPHDPELDTGERTKLLLNDGTGHFTLQADTGLCNTDANFSSAGFGDYDRDGYLDLYVGTWLLEYPYAESDPDFLFHSNGDYTWTDVSLTSGIREDDDNPAAYKPSYGVTWVDYNDDGWYDIFVSNYGRTFNLLFENQGDGTFVEVGGEKNLDRPHTGTMGPGNTFGADFGDVNNDGYFDAIVSDIAHPRYEPGSGMSSFNYNDGPPDYTYTWANDQVLFHEDEGDVDPSFVDYDNDGRLDMFISSLYGGHYSRFYQQQEDGAWLDVSYWTGVETLAAAGNAWADYDGDGRMDLCSIFEPRADGVGGVWLFHNDLDNGNHWLEINLIGVADNRDAIGAKIHVTAGDLNVYRYVQGPRGHYGATPMYRQHFGLAQQSIIDTIEVRWPNGEVETWSGVNADQIITLTQGDPNVGK